MNPRNAPLKRIFIMTCGLLLTFLLTSCSGGGNNRQPEYHDTGETGIEPVDVSGMESVEISFPPEEPVNETNTEEGETMKMNVQVGDSTFTATLEENKAADAFVEQMEIAPVVIRMSDYSGFEKVGPSGTALPAENSQITTQSGDIVLYNDSRIVIFYGSNSWSYTRLGKIDDLTGWEEALGDGDVTVTFSVNESGCLEDGQQKDQ